MMAGENIQDGGKITDISDKLAKGNARPAG